MSANPDLLQSDSQSLNQDKNAYTDSPDLHPHLLLGSFHLLFWLIFHPTAWRHYLHRIDANLTLDFTLTELKPGQWRHPLLSRLLVQIYLILPLLVGLTAGLTLLARSTSTQGVVVFTTFIIGINLTLSLMIGAVISVAAGLVGGVLTALAAGLAMGVLLPVGTTGVVVATAISFAIGITGTIAGAVVCQNANRALTQKTLSLSTQVGSIVIGVLVGVVAAGLVRFGLTVLAGLLGGLPETIGYNLARSVVVGGSFGIAIGWRRGLRSGTTAGVAGGLAYIIAVIGGNSDLNGILVGLCAGLLFGLSFGATVVLPYTLSEQIAGAWAGAWAGALGSWGRHVIRNNIPLWPAFPLGLIGVALGLTLTWWRPLVSYPFTAAWNLILYRLDERRSDHQRPLLRWHSAFWDELQRLPLTGLDDHLLLTLERNPQEGQQALAYLRKTPQRWAAQAVQIECEARRLESYDQVTTISCAHQALASGELIAPASAILRNFRRLSQDVEAALNQTTTYHQRLALKATGDRLNSLARELTMSSDPYAMRFHPAATRWEQIVSQYAETLAETAEKSQEIDNPYVVGIPLTTEQEIFIGRADIVARIEQLLPDRRRPPLLLYGQRRMGKTSLLRNLGRLLPQHIVPLFVDGQKTFLAADYPDFLYNIAREMIRSAEQQRRLPLPPPDRKALFASPFTGFNEWLDTVEQILIQTDRTALLALDEFEALNRVVDKGRFDAADVLSLLRHIIQHRDRFKVMLAGSHTLDELQHWAGYLINVQVVKIDCLKESEARQLIEHPVKDFALRYEPDACERVLTLTRCHPALTQLLCYEIVALKNEQHSADRRLTRLADVEAAVPQALVSGSFFFSDIEHNQIDAAGLSLLRFIATWGEGALISRRDLAAHIPQSDRLDQTLTLLLRRDLIETVGEKYRFRIELIRRWFEQSG